MITDKAPALKQGLFYFWDLFSNQSQNGQNPSWCIRLKILPSRSVATRTHINNITGDNTIRVLRWVALVALLLTFKPPYKHTSASPANFDKQVVQQAEASQASNAVQPQTQPVPAETAKVVPVEVVTAVAPVAVAVTPEYPKGCENYVTLVSQYDWNVTVALNIMRAESGCNPHAIGDTRVIGGLYAPSCGLMQIRTLAGRPTCDQLQDPATNLEWAYKLYRTQTGWYHWSVCRTSVSCY